MLLFPNCKINLGLAVTGKLDDGFHTIETVMFPVPLYDILEMIVSPSGKFSFTTSGLQIPGNQSDNLVVKAYNLLKEDFGLKPVEIHLHKAIPMGAGLGGGSSDGAFAVKLLNSLFGLKLNNDEMRNYASMLGSDCPFFIENKPVLATGKGDVFEDIEIDLSGLYLVIVKPDIHINTAEAYSMIKPSGKSPDLKSIVSQPVESWKGVLKNDFEQPVFISHPDIRNIKEKLYKKGAIFASMSGSGSAVYGIFRERINLDGVFGELFVWGGTLNLL